MAILRVRIYPDPMLKKKTRPVKQIGPEEKKIFEDMAQTMYAEGGVGLSANQVGLDRRLMVVDVGAGLYKFANPMVVKKECRRMREEGCLSLPDITVKLKRPEKIILEAVNQDGRKAELEAEGLLARAIQHEIDHLDGIVLLDRAGLKDRLRLKRKVAKLKRLRTAWNVKIPNSKSRIPDKSQWPKFK